MNCIMSNKLLVLEKIASLAGELDGAGLFAEADALDSVIVSLAGKHGKVIKVPDIRQYNEYSCGSACLLALLSHWGVYDGNEKKLAQELGTNHEHGTDPHSIARVARSMGLDSSVKTDCSLAEIKAAIQAEQPPMVNFQAWSDKKQKDWEDAWEDGHYAICVGIDDDHIYLRDPVIYNKTGYLSIDSFKKRWHDVDSDGNKIHRMVIFVSGKQPPPNDQLSKVE